MGKTLDDYLREHKIDPNSFEMVLIGQLMEVQIEYFNRLGENSAPGGFDEQQEKILAAHVAAIAEAVRAARIEGLGQLKRVVVVDQEVKLIPYINPRLAQLTKPEEK